MTINGDWCKIESVPQFSYNPYEYWQQYYLSLQMGDEIKLAEDTAGESNQEWEQETMVMPKLYFPYQCAMAFGNRALRDVDDLTPEQVKLLVLREAASGFEYGRGIDQYNRTVLKTPSRLLSLSEKEVRLVALVVYHESSEGEFGDGFSAMLSWVVFNALATTRHVYQVGGDDLYFAVLNAKWESVASWLGGTDKWAINSQHTALISTESYNQIYEIAWQVAYDYLEEKPDPSNHATNAISVPQKQASVLAPTGYKTGEYLKGNLEVYAELLRGYYEYSGSIGVANFLMTRGTFFRVEHGSYATTIVNWQFLIPDNTEPTNAKTE